MQLETNALPNPTDRTQPTRLALDHIILDGRLQSRQLQPEVVKEYLGALRRGEELPPIRVVRWTPSVGQKNVHF
jgi:hypothetical protein